MTSAVAIWATRSRISESLTAFSLRWPSQSRPGVPAAVDSLATLPPVPATIALSHTPQCPRTSGHPSRPLRHWLCSTGKQKPECPLGTPCRREGRSGKRAVFPRFLHSSVIELGSGKTAVGPNLDLNCGQRLADGRHHAPQNRHNVFLRFGIERPLELLNLFRSFQAHANLLALARWVVCLELRLLPSTGVTRLHRYYKPVRHPTRPGLSLAGLRFKGPSLPSGASRVASHPLLHACWRHYPDGFPSASLFLARVQRPSLNLSQVGFRITLFEACSAFTTRYGLHARQVA